MDGGDSVRARPRLRDGDALMKTAEELWEATEKWVDDNPMAYAALIRATRAVSDRGIETPMNFLSEMLRYNSVMGTDLMHQLVDTLSHIAFFDGEFAIPNAVVPGVARLISAQGYPVKLGKSRMDEVSHA